MVDIMPNVLADAATVNGYMGRCVLLVAELFEEFNALSQTAEVIVQ